MTQATYSRRVGSEERPWRLKGCLHCGGDQQRSEDGWTCLQCGRELPFERAPRTVLDIRGEEVAIENALAIAYRNGD